MLFQLLCARVSVVIQIFLCIDEEDGTILKACRNSGDGQIRFRQMHFVALPALHFSHCQKNPSYIEAVIFLLHSKIILIL